MLPKPPADPMEEEDPTGLNEEPAEPKEEEPADPAEPTLLIGLWEPMELPKDDPDWPNPETEDGWKDECITDGC